MPCRLENHLTERKANVESLRGSLSDSFDAAVKFTGSIFKGAANYVYDTYIHSVTNNTILLNTMIVALTHMPLQLRDPQFSEMQTMIINNPALYNTAMDNVKISINNVKVFRLYINSTLPEICT